MKSTVIALTIVAVTNLILTARSAADLIEGTTIESATVGLNPEMGPEKAINGAGLSGGVPSLTASHDQTFSNNWWSGWDGAITEWQITVDLEDNYALDQVQVWNYREGCCYGRGLKDVEIWVASDENEGNLTKLVTDGTGAQDDGNGNFQFPQAPQGGDYFGFTLDTSGVTNSALLGDVRLFRVNGGSSLWVSPSAEVHGGLAEIHFDGSPPIRGSFAITAIEYSPETSEVTLTWRKTGATSYVAKYSVDMIAVGDPPTAWGMEMSDGLTDELDENPGDADHMTVTFDLTEFSIESEPDLFFRIEEE